MDLYLHALVRHHSTAVALIMKYVGHISWWKRPLNVEWPLQIFMRDVWSQDQSPNSCNGETCINQVFLLVVPWHSLEAKLSFPFIFLQFNFISLRRYVPVVCCSKVVLKSTVLHNRYNVDKKNQLDVTFCILYFSSNSCSTCFGQPCAHHQELTTTWCCSLVLVRAVAAGRWSRPVGR